MTRDAAEIHMRIRFDPQPKPPSKAPTEPIATFAHHYPPIDSEDAHELRRQAIAVVNAQGAQAWNQKMNRCAYRSQQLGQGTMELRLRQVKSSPSRDHTSDHMSHRTISHRDHHSHRQSTSEDDHVRPNLHNSSSPHQLWHHSEPVTLT